MSGPKPAEICLTLRQKDILNQIYKKHKAPFDQRQRARIILLADKNFSNTEIARELSIWRRTVRKWRDRWAKAIPTLTIFEQGDVSKKELAQIMEQKLEDSYRSGTPPKFSAEQLTQIIAIACQSPSDSNLPITHWTARDLANEVIKRKIVDSISPNYVRVLLERADLKPHRVKYWETPPSTRP